MTPCRLVEIFKRFEEYVASLNSNMGHQTPLIFLYFYTRQHGVISADIGRNTDYVEQGR